MARALVLALMLVMGSLAAVTATVAAARRQRHLGLYSSGYASGMAGLWLLSTQGWLPPILSVVAANLLLAWFPLALFVGLRLWLRASPLWPWRFTGYLGGLVAALILGLTVWPSYQFRALAASVLAVVATVDVIVLLGISVKHLSRVLVGALVAVGGGFLVCNLVKIVLLLLPDSAATTMMADTPANVFSFSYALVFCVAWVGLVLVIDSVELIKVLEGKNAELRALATTDTLTGVGNRQALDVRAAAEVERARRYSHPLALILFDLDHFKAVNDAWGHETGDQVLRTAARTVVAGVRDADGVYRWGGEEFIVLVPHTDLRGAEALAESLRQALAGLTHPRAGRVTASFGVSAWQGDLTWQTWFQRADQALYAAKRKGRNRVEVWSLAGETRQPRVALEWSPDWESGDPAIDVDHRYLLDLANRLLDEAADPSPRLDRLFEELDTHLVDHFAAEEAVLEVLDYPDAARHRARHQELLSHVRDLENAHARNETSALELYRFVVKEVIQDHMLTEDMEFVAHTRQTGPSRLARSRS